MLTRILLISFTTLQLSSSFPQAVDRCNPTPCGANSRCRVEDGGAICSCQPTYIGNPRQGCKRECETDDGCLASKGCLNFKCKDPCVGGCTDHAICQVVNHKADCKCPPDFLGDGYNFCSPECSSHAECPANRACLGHKCGDPCLNSKLCGRNALCKVNTESHKATCRCPPGWSGHPGEVCHPPSG